MANAKEKERLIKGNKLSKDAKRSPLEWISPMLASLTTNYFSHPDWIYECKMDGERCLAYCDTKGHITLYSRNKQILNNTYPEIVKALQNSNAKSFIIDGEIVAFDYRGITSFMKLQDRLKLKIPQEQDIQKTPVCYCIFDILYLGGYDLRDIPLIERKVLLEKNISFNKTIIFTKHYKKYGVRYYEFACKKGLEGIIAKNSLSTYQTRRSKDWLKFKCSNQQEFIIVGYTKPKGSRVEIGALLLGYYDGNNLLYAGKVGTGFTRDTLCYLKNMLLPLRQEKKPINETISEKPITWVQPVLICQVAFTEWTNDNKLRHPRYLGLREDKLAQDVIREDISQQNLIK